MTTNRATTEWFLQAKHWISSIDNVWLGDRHNLCRSIFQTSIATSIPFWGRQSTSLHLGLLHFLWISSECSPLTRKCDPPTSSSKWKFMNTAPVPEKIVGNSPPASSQAACNVPEYRANQVCDKNDGNDNDQDDYRAIFANKALRFIDRQRVTWRPTQFVSVNWQNYDRHFHTFLESTEYFSTLWGSPFPVNLSRKGTTGKKVWSINFFVEEGVRELRSQTAPVPFRCFNQSSEDGKIVGQSKSS